MLSLWIKLQQPQFFGGGRYLNLMCRRMTFSMDDVGKVTQRSWVLSWAGAEQVTMDHKNNFNHALLTLSPLKYFAFCWRGDTMCGSRRASADVHPRLCFPYWMTPWRDTCRRLAFKYLRGLTISTLPAHARGDPNRGLSSGRLPFRRCIWRSSFVVRVFTLYPSTSAW